MGKQHTIAMIRARRAAGLARPRRRLPRQQQPDGIRLEYFKAIRDRVLAPARAALAHVFADLPALLEQARREHAAANPKTDADEGKRAAAMIESTAKDFAERVRPAALDGLARTFAQRTADFQSAQLKQQVRAAVGVELPVHENLGPAISSFVAENVARIKSIPAQYFDDVEKTVTRAVAAGTRWEDLAEDLEDRYGVAESSAKLIARDQVGKFYGRLNATRQQSLGVTRFIWRTANDSRVREEHQVLEGESFSYDDPPAEGLPGDPINCRCVAEPDFASINDDADEADEG